MRRVPDSGGPQVEHGLGGNAIRSHASCKSPDFFCHVFSFAMGVIRFRLPPSETLAEMPWLEAYFSNSEGVPWPCMTEVDGGELRVQRQVSESGLLQVPWIIPGRGKFMLTTTNLREQPEPYDLCVELARGAVFRLRAQMANWEAAGLRVDHAVRSAVTGATTKFAEAIFATDASQRALGNVAAIYDALAAMELLVDAFSAQSLAMRKKEQKGQLPKWLACRIDAPLVEETLAQRYQQAFNGAVLVPRWRTIEATEGEYDWGAPHRVLDWCRERNLRICVGPILRNDVDSIPSWLYLWQDDEETLTTYLNAFVRAVVTEFSGQVGLWNVCAGFNVAGTLELSEEIAVRLMAGSVSTVRQIDRKTPLIVSFACPFAEYMAKLPHELSPLYLADALLRADLGISGVGLEFDIELDDQGVPLRDLVQLNAYLDRWAVLGVPLIVFLTVPNGPQLDAASDVTPPSIERLTSFLMAKRNVHGLVWNQFCEGEAGRPHAGLVDANRQPKPALQFFQDFCREYLE